MASAPPARQLHRTLTLVACIVGSGMVFLDGTVVNVALPAIRHELGGGLAAQEWVVEGYLLSLSALLLIGGSLGDLLGRRRIFAAGIVSFGALSLVCAIAPTIDTLIAARVLQGVAGALLVPSTLALLMDTFPESERGAAIGTWTAFGGVATVIGPLGGGALVDAASWRWVFAINLAPAVITLLLLRFAPPGHRESARIDFTGALLAALGLAGPVFALIEQPREGWSSPLVLVALIAGLALLAAFLVWERRAHSPMLPLDVFRSRNFSVGNGATLAIYGGLGAFTFTLPVYLQQVAGYRALQAGLSMLPITVVMFALSRRFGALADRAGPRLFMGLGPIAAGAGLLLFVRVNAHPSYVADILPAVLVFALGLAMTVAPLTATVLGAADDRHAGVASGINNAIARVAGLLAIAVVGAVISGYFASRVDGGVRHAALTPLEQRSIADGRRRPLTVSGSTPRVQATLRSASVDAFHLAAILGAALTAAGGLLSLAGIRNPRREVRAGDCPGGALVGANREQRPESPRAGEREAEPVGAGAG
ncbi:MAG: MFS transporter [Solirubrobacteraceae bacterium]|nr:MAG: MFS transporter [Solirubrobacterales bacterium]